MTCLRHMKEVTSWQWAFHGQSSFLPAVRSRNDDRAFCAPLEELPGGAHFAEPGFRKIAFSEQLVLLSKRINYFMLVGILNVCLLAQKWIGKFLRNQFPDFGWIIIRERVNIYKVLLKKNIGSKSNNIKTRSFCKHYLETQSSERI